MIDRMISEKSLIDNLPKSSLEEIDSIARDITNGYSFSQQNMADWNEMMGDFWYQYGYVSNYVDYYLKAFDYESPFNDSASFIQSQRILEKLTSDLQPGNMEDNSFKDLGLKCLNILLTSTSVKVKDFYYHNKLVAYFYQQDYTDAELSSIYEITDLVLGIKKSSLYRRLCVEYLDAIRSKIKNRNNFELQKKCENTLV